MWLWKCDVYFVYLVRSSHRVCLFRASLQLVCDCNCDNNALTVLISICSFYRLHIERIYQKKWVAARDTNVKQQMAPKLKQQKPSHTHNKTHKHNYIYYIFCALGLSTNFKQFYLSCEIKCSDKHRILCECVCVSVQNPMNMKRISSMVCEI